MKKIFFLAMLASALLASVENSYALKCEPVNLNDAFKNADIVVAGVIHQQSMEKISGKRMGIAQTTREPMEYKFTYYKTTLSLIPVKIWKGEARNKISVSYKQDSEKELVLDQKSIHLLFAKKDKKVGEYTIHTCSPRANLGSISSYFNTLLLDKMKKDAPIQIGDRNENNMLVTSYPRDVPGFTPDFK